MTPESGGGTQRCAPRPLQGPGGTLCPASKITAFRLVKSTLPNGGGETSMTRWYNRLEENSQLQDILKCQRAGAGGEVSRKAPLLLRSHTRRCRCVVAPVFLLEHNPCQPQMCFQSRPFCPDKMIHRLIFLFEFRS